MIALAVSLAALLALSMSASVAMFVALRGETRNARDAEHLAATYLKDRDAHAEALAVTQRQLETANNLRSIAEAQRNEAERRVRDLLVAHAKDATDDEIRSMVANAFRSPLASVPSVPAAADPDADRDGLLNPFVRPPGAAR